MENVTVTITENTDNNYHQYPGQCQLQGARVLLECAEGQLSSEWDSNIGGGVSGYVWHRRDLVFGISSYLTVDAINELLEQVKPLAQRVVNGYECEWDGSNHVGTYTDDAEEAIEEIKNLCESYDGDCFDVFEWEDWFVGSDWKKAAHEYSSLEEMEDGEKLQANNETIFESEMEDYISDEVEYLDDDEIEKLPEWVKNLDRVKTEITSR